MAIESSTWQFPELEFPNRERAVDFFAANKGATDPRTLQASMDRRSVWRCDEKNAPTNHYLEVVEHFRKLSAEDRKRYAELYESTAAAALSAATYEQLPEIAHRFRFTKSGEVAAQRLMHFALDRGEAHLGSLYFDGWLSDHGAELDGCAPGALETSVLGVRLLGITDPDAGDDIVKRILKCNASIEIGEQKQGLSEWYAEYRRGAEKRSGSHESWIEGETDELELAQSDWRRRFRWAVTYQGDPAAFKDVLHSPYTFCLVYDVNKSFPERWREDKDVDFVWRLFPRYGASFVYQELTGETRNPVRAFKDFYLHNPIIPDMNKDENVFFYHAMGMILVMEELEQEREKKRQDRRR